MPKIPPGLVAQADQELADANRRLDNLVEGTRLLVRDNGTTGGRALSMLHLGDVGDLEPLLAAALIRLAERES